MLASLFDKVPFDQHRVVNTTDPDEARQQIGAILNSYKLEITRGRIIHAQLDLLPCGRLSLIKLRHGYGADISIDPDCRCLDGYYLLVIPTQGKAAFYYDGHLIEVSPSSAYILSPDRPFYFHANPQYEQILLRLDRSTLSDAWQRLTQQAQAPHVYFDAEIPLHTAAWQALLPMLQWIVRCSHLGHGKKSIDAAILAHTETMVATTLLLHQPHSMAAQLWPSPPPSAPKTLRRAQAYMLENVGEKLPIAMIASHCGLSVRRLQALFQDECNQSPLQWLRQQRLQAAHQTLSDPNNTDKVSDVATRYGFTNLSDFSRIYRAVYGETPLRTRKESPAPL